MFRPAPRRGFTLVEMLVVIGIIGVLAALLLPAVMSAVSNARNVSMSTEIAQLEDAIESYKEEKGDYPPGFRDQGILIRHLRKAYPKMNANQLLFFFEQDPMNPNQPRVNPNYNPNAPISATNERYVWKQGKQLDEGEALVFWLSLTTADPREPFTGQPKKVYYDFVQSRLVDGGGNDIDPDPMDTLWVDPDHTFYPSYKPDYAGDSCYVLIDSRAYAVHVNSSLDIPAQAEDGDFGATRSYVAQVSASGAPTYVNPTKFQIICAGQDGVFDDNSPPGGMFVNTAPDYGFKLYPAGMNYTASDKDNLTNFSEGRTLVNAIP